MNLSKRFEQDLFKTGSTIIVVATDRSQKQPAECFVKKMFLHISQYSY